MRDVQIAAEHDGLFCVQSKQMGAQRLLKRHAEVEPGKRFLCVGRIAGNEIQVAQVHRNNAPFAVERCVAKPADDLQRLTAAEYRRTGVTLLLRAVPVLPVSGQRNSRLLRLHFCFLQGQHIR